MEPIATAIANRDIRTILTTLFEASDVVGAPPRLRAGYRRETEYWDFKRGLPGDRAQNDGAWARVAADILAFHNAKGGVIFFGIADRSYEFVGTRDFTDAKQFNDKVRRYVGDKFWIDFSREFIQPDQRYLGVAVVGPHGLDPVRVRDSAPLDEGGKRLFTVGDLCVRVGDETRIYRREEAETFLARERLPASNPRFLVHDADYRILRPDWDRFIDRAEACAQVMDGLKNDRTYVTTLTGIGGIGKTALACWAALQAYKAGGFEHIVSVSAKDRELTYSGIRPVRSTLTSFDDLLNQILEVLGFSEYVAEDVTKREQTVRELLAGLPVLLFVDNLETVKDQRVVRFLETLPKPIKAITTSRTAVVRTAAFPVPVGPMTIDESILLLDHHSRRQARGLHEASRAEKQRMVEACSRVPLAIEWFVAQSRNQHQAMELVNALSLSDKRDAELLEFCFRRVHSTLTGPARGVLAALALDEKPAVIEALGAAGGMPVDVVDEALEELEACGLVERVWDSKMQDFAFRTLDLTRRFAYRDLGQQAGLEEKMQRRLADWYEGQDVAADTRAAVVSARRGDRDPDAALVDAAIALRREGKTDEAEKFFAQAIGRNPRSWRAYREYGELLRDRGSVAAAIEQYKEACRCSPKRGPDRALIFREYGMLLRRSGQADAAERAAEALEVARKETPNDPLVLHALGQSYVRLGHYARAQPILEVLVRTGNAETRARSYDLLRECYEQQGETLKLAELRKTRAADTAAAAATVTSKRTIEGSSRPMSHKARGRRFGRRRRKR